MKNMMKLKAKYKGKCDIVDEVVLIEGGAYDIIVSRDTSDVLPMIDVMVLLPAASKYLSLCYQGPSMLKKDWGQRAVDANEELIELEVIDRNEL